MRVRAEMWAGARTQRNSVNNRTELSSLGRDRPKITLDVGNTANYAKLQTPLRFLGNCVVFCGSVCAESPVAGKCSDRVSGNEGLARNLAWAAEQLWASGLLAHVRISSNRIREKSVHYKVDITGRKYLSQRGHEPALSATRIHSLTIDFTQDSSPGLVCEDQSRQTTAPIGGQIDICDWSILCSRFVPRIWCELVTCDFVNWAVVLCHMTFLAITALQDEGFFVSPIA
ncbi:hypothetical protein J6590_072340 [Homalodisca vitripennis]|nr:hypothetical protein J6590_072340 [Homalodisca vitripennis]